jgi:hypothetical protein
VGKKTPAPLGISPSRFSLGEEPLNVEWSGLDTGWGPETERLMAREAIRRGADSGQVFQLLWKWRQARGHARRSLALLRGSPLPGPSFGLGARPFRLADEFADVAYEMDRPIDFEMIQVEHRSYRRAALDEYETLPAHVKRSFGDPAPLTAKGSHQPTERQLRDFANAQTKAAEKYLAMRPLYYMFGYSDPPRFLKTIQPSRMVGHDVDYGLHPEFAKRLQGLAEALVNRDPSLRNREGTVLRSAIGLQPRAVAGESRPSLSNHAFGLAVDVDAITNPMLKDGTVIRILNWVVGEPSFDFGEYVVGPKEHVALPTETAYARLKEASLRVQDWLKRHLYDLQVSRPEDPDAAADQQSRELADDDVRNFRILSDRVPRRDLEAWAREGILTIPLSLVLAMKDLQFGWGGEYEHSKDMMHFELNYWDIVPRDSGFEGVRKGQPCRLLDELTPESLKLQRRRK